MKRKQAEKISHRPYRGVGEIYIDRLTGRGAITIDPKTKWSDIAAAFEDFAKFLNTLPEEGGNEYAEYDEGKMY